MPDIFGREPRDYEHLAMLDDAGVLDSYLDDQATVWSQPRHNFDALGARGSIESLQDVEPHAQALGYLSNNLQAMQAMVQEVLYTEFRLDDFLPIKMDVPEGAASYSYKVLDRVGQGRFIDREGTSAPSAGVALRNVPYPLAYGGIKPTWTREDLRQAMFGGVALDTEIIRAGTIGAMDHIEQVGLLGDGIRDFEGLVDHSGITDTDESAKWATLTPDNLVKRLQAITLAAITRTEEVFGRTMRSGFCLYLPLVQAALVSETRLTDINMSVWNYYKANNSWTTYTGETPMLKWVTELAGAAGSSNDRAIVGFKNDAVMEMAIPFMPRVLSIMDEGFRLTAPIEYKVSGLNVKHPKAMHYHDII